MNIFYYRVPLPHHSYQFFFRPNDDVLIVTSKKLNESFMDSLLSFIYPMRNPKEQEVLRRSSKCVLLTDRQITIIIKMKTIVIINNAREFDVIFKRPRCLLRGISLHYKCAHVRRNTKLTFRRFSFFRSLCSVISVIYDNSFNELWCMYSVFFYELWSDQFETSRIDSISKRKQHFFFLWIRAFGNCVLFSICFGLWA